MAYFRVLPQELKGTSDDFIDIFYDFANSYTEESVRAVYWKAKEEQSAAPEASDMRDILGYTEEEMSGMELLYES